MGSHDLNFPPELMKRLERARRVLGCTYSELVEFAVRQSLDEFDAISRDAEAIRAYYSGS